MSPCSFLLLHIVLHFMNLLQWIYLVTSSLEKCESSFYKYSLQESRFICATVLRYYKAKRGIATILPSIVSQHSPKSLYQILLLPVVSKNSYCSSFSPTHSVVTLNSFPIWQGYHGFV